MEMTLYSTLFLSQTRHRFALVAFVKTHFRD